MKAESVTQHNPSTRPKPRKEFHKLKDYTSSYLFVLPALSFLTMFSIIPIIYLIWLSFYSYSLPSPPEFTGLGNYTQMLKDKLFIKSIGNTLVYTAGSMVIGLSGAIAVAVLLNRKLKGIRLFKVFYFLPTITSEVITAMIFLWVFDNNLGILNYILKVAGVENPPAWLLQPGTAMLILILIGAWRGTAYNIPIFLAALQAVPQSLYEAARIDGANAWKQFWHITLPSIMHILVYCMVMSVIGSFQVVAVVDILTNGGPMDSTMVAIKHIWQQAFEFNYVGYGAALSFVLFPFLLFVTWLQLKLSSGKDK
ncbi:carbohydrate ABC transporter permease [Alkalihalobacillus sp. TS-13]|uniref:carbohydrate ABC transporter permease n=1 Tax=Alkalihalobacillus sp. TS-13 TaxID=2842455 RepID=UPI001C87BC33|nr:sugar ABC transporter permease [Alkalihalobacillus sp. TS-13]